MKSILTSYSDKQQATTIGGKARNLLLLEKIGLTVPQWAVIPEDVLLHQLPDTDDVAQIQAASANLQVPDDILGALEEYFGNDALASTYAVRSSALQEDGAAFSFAGQFTTFLHVPFLEIPLKIMEIWRSVYSDRVMTYCRTNNLKPHFGIAVIIQKMIDADVAGVGFGIDPVQNDPTVKVISSVYGLGESIVSGEANADTFRVSASEITELLACKTHELVRNADGSGVIQRDIAQDRQLLPSLTHSQLYDIAKVLDVLHEHLGSPQDIEFAFQSSVLYLLQTRPITTRKPQPEGEYTVWDNSNIIESYPGITTPLTFTFILKMYTIAYKQLVRLMGVSPEVIATHEHIFAHTLGLVRGRVYYNLLHWYKMLALLPGYRINAENMERMMGVKERFELDESTTMSLSAARIKLILMSIKMLYLFVRLPKETRKFQAHIDAVIQEYKRINFNALPPNEIITAYKKFESSLLLEWKAPLINDFFSMIWLGILKKLTHKYCASEPNLHNDLLCSSNDIISVEPIHRCIEIATAIAAHSEAKRLFTEQSPDEILAALRSGMHSQVNELIQDYIRKFGNRCVGELKLETISYEENPALLIRIIKTYIEQNITSMTTTHDIGHTLRADSERTMLSALGNHPVRRAWFGYVVRKTRTLISNRENLRFERTRGFGMVRTMLSSLGRVWHERGHLREPRDIFYMELEEILAMEHHFDPTILDRIEARKAEFRDYVTQEPPQERFFTYGENFSDEYIYSTAKAESARTDLQGIGCCPGVVRAAVRVIRSPQDADSLNGDILVTMSTDPGWVTLFPTVSGIIVEKGSLLSHSAIVAREMGIPCIVSVSGLLKTLKTGDIIIMNGALGSIEIVSQGDRE